VIPFGGPDQGAESGRSLIALDADTGRRVWTSGTDQISFASPTLITLDGVRQIVSVNERTVSGHAIADGSVLWSFDWPGSSSGDANCASAVAAGPNRFLVGKGYGGGSALVDVRRQDDRWAAQPVWKSPRVLKTKFSQACVDGQVAYALSNGSLEAVEIASGKKLWQQPRGSRFKQGQMVLVEDVLVVQAETGEVAIVEADPEEFRQRLRWPALDTKTWNIPAVAGRHLLVRNDRRAICFLLPPRPQPSPAGETVSR
jgi:outer membrane protein assembly factor BamB